MKLGHIFGAFGVLWLFTAAVGLAIMGGIIYALYWLVTSPAVMEVLGR